jgi:hypothetical protein
MRFLSIAASTCARPVSILTLLAVLLLGRAARGDAQAGTDAPPAAATDPDSPAQEPRAALGAPLARAPTPEYERAIAQAVDEHERGNFEEAREHFREAHEIYPNARTLRGLGKVEFELRNYGECVKFLAAALGSEERPLSQPLRDEVTALLERARAYVGEVHVDVQPGSATVSVDGVPVASGPQAALDLLVGDHVLEFRASGHLSERRRIHVRGHDTINIQVVLAAPETSVAVHTGASERPPGQPPVYKQWWLWTAVGVVAVGTATALALSLRSTPEPHHAENTSGVTLRAQ